MKLEQEKLLIATVSYADIFDWPLTEDDLKQWHIHKPFSYKSLRESSAIRRILISGVTYIFLKRKYYLVAKRRDHEVYAKIKWKIARRVGKILQIIPTLKLVGVTGGLSRNNVDKDDDIDLFCITESHTLWISRFLTVLIVSILGMRRRPGEQMVKNKICLNMFMSEGSLSLPMGERDLFGSYEVLQMEPLWERNNTYRKFLNKNSWVKFFLPGAWKKKIHSKQAKTNRSSKILIEIFYFLLSIFEPYAKKFQLWYMRDRRTNEIISTGILRFHPDDRRSWIKSKFSVRLSNYNLPLDKIFYRS